VDLHGFENLKKDKTKGNIGVFHKIKELVKV